MKNFQNLKGKRFVIYGLGKTGKSSFNYLKKKKIKKIITWDDGRNHKNKIKRKDFITELINSDYIIVSPGIDIKKSLFKKYLIKSSHKIITDLDLFFLYNNPYKSIIVTGTNGKSTTCSIIEYILRRSGLKTELVGNIGKPILDKKFSKKTIYVIEASSYQLEYSKLIKPDFALLLNISNDHLNWHGSLKNYTDSKFKIFKNQTSKDFSFINNKKLIDLFRKKNFKSKLHKIKKNFLKNELSKYSLNFQTETENIEFALEVVKKFRISKNFFFKSLASFKGLYHRHEIFLKTKKFVFINDSKATSFISSEKAILNNDNIIWILGGLPKTDDKINVDKIKKRIAHAYIIGKKPLFFANYLRGKVKYTIKKSLKDVLKIIFKNQRNVDKKITVLFSPASASFDQFKNFEDRGNKFKKYTKTYVKRFF